MKFHSCVRATMLIVIGSVAFGACAPKKTTARPVTTKHAHHTTGHPTTKMAPVDKNKLKAAIVKKAEALAGAAKAKAVTILPLLKKKSTIAPPTTKKSKTTQAAVSTKKVVTPAPTKKGKKSKVTTPTVEASTVGEAAYEPTTKAGSEPESVAPTEEEGGTTEASDTPAPDDGASSSEDASSSEAAPAEAE